MADVRMPKLSDNMEEGTIIRWMKAPGDRVEKGEPLAEVETEKADVELEASASGVLQEIKVAEGKSAAVGAVIAVLGEGDGKASAQPKPSAAAAAPGDAEASEDEAQGDDGDGEAARVKPKERSAKQPTAAAPARESKPVRAGGTAREAASAGGPPPADGRPPRERAVRASPLAWKVADEAGVNLASLRGSGPGGRIVKRDVEAAVRGPAPEGSGGEEESAGDDQSDESGAKAPGAERPAKTAGGSRIEPASKMRATIARRMTEAKRDIPHFYVRAEIDMSEAMHLRESIKRRDAMPGLTVTHMLVRALATALERHPRVNASWGEDGIVLHDDVNIGIAVAVEDGLVVPVLHRAQTLTLREISERATALTEKARQGRFGGDDLSGGTFSISNVGMLDVEDLVAVINPPQAAILAVGAVKDRPVVRDGQVVVAKTLRATLSCDHRVLNGVEGGRFLVELKAILENPVTLLLE